MGGKVLPYFRKRSRGILIQLTMTRRSSLIFKDSSKSILRKGISLYKIMPLLIGLIGPELTFSADRFPLLSSLLTF